MKAHDSEPFSRGLRIRRTSYCDGTLRRATPYCPETESLLHDFRFAIRVLAKRPWLTAMMVLVLAAGIGVNTTVSALFNAVLVRGLPFPDGDRVLFLAWAGISWKASASPDIRQNNANEREIRPVVYRAFGQEPSAHAYFLIHSRTGAAELAPAFRDAVAEVDPHLPVQDLMLLDQRLDRSRWPYRVFGTAFSIFGAIALGMAALGVFALVADSVRSRIPEFGVRLAFGAPSGHILRLVVFQAMRRVAVGVLLGLPLAYAGSTMLESVLVGVEPADKLNLGGVSLFLMATPLAACWVPARRVTRIDAATALRDE